MQKVVIVMLSGIILVPDFWTGLWFLQYFWIRIGFGYC